MPSTKPYQRTTTLPRTWGPTVVALCRRELLPALHRCSDAGAINLLASLAEHDALWAWYLELVRELQIKLTELTLAFIESSVGDARK